MNVQRHKEQFNRIQLVDDYKKSLPKLARDDSTSNFHSEYFVSIKKNPPISNDAMRYQSNDAICCSAKTDKRNEVNFFFGLWNTIHMKVLVRTAAKAMWHIDMCEVFPPEISSQIISHFWHRAEKEKSIQKLRIEFFHFYFANGKCSNSFSKWPIEIKKKLI